MRNDMTDEEYEQLEARETDGARGCAYLPAPETSAAAKSKFDWEPVAKELAAELERVKRSMESWQQTADKLNQELERVRQSEQKTARECAKLIGEANLTVERVKQQLERQEEGEAEVIDKMTKELTAQIAARKRAEASEARLLAALKDAEAMLSAGNEQGIGVIRAAIAATEQCGRGVK